MWNHAVYRFRATFSEAPGGNERIVQIANELTANDDSEPPTPDSLILVRAFTYTYIVEYQQGVVLTSGVHDFMSVSGEAHFAPSNLLHIKSADWRRHNIWMTVAEVMADDGSN